MRTLKAYRFSAGSFWVGATHDEEAAAPPLLLVNGEAVAMRRAAPDDDLWRATLGCQLLASPEDMRWRLADDAAPDLRLGCNYRPDFSLEDGFTWYLEQDFGANDQYAGRAVYVDPVFGDIIPVFANTLYTLRAYVGQARAHGVVGVELLGDDGVTRTLEQRFSIDNIGGRSLDGYGRIEIPFTPLKREVHARIFFAIDGRKTDGSDIMESHIFIANPTLVMGPQPAEGAEPRPLGVAYWQRHTTDAVWTAPLPLDQKVRTLAFKPDEDAAPIPLPIRRSPVEDARVELESDGVALAMTARNWTGRALLVVDNQMVGDIFLTDGASAAFQPPAESRHGAPVNVRAVDVSLSSVLGEADMAFDPGLLPLSPRLGGALSGQALRSPSMIDVDVLALQRQASVDALAIAAPPADRAEPASVTANAPDEASPALEAAPEAPPLPPPPPTLLALLREAASHAGGDWICVCADGVRPDVIALGEMVATAAIHPGAAVVGARVVDRDGATLHAGGFGGHDAAGANPFLPVLSFAARCESVDPSCVLVRRDALARTSASDDASWPDILAAVAAQGGAVYAPTAVIRRDIKATTPGAGQSMRLAARRRAPAGVCLMLDMRFPAPNRDAGSDAALQEVRLLKDLGFHVAMWTHEPAPEIDTIVNLARLGVERRGPPFDASLADAIVAMGPELTLVFATRHGVAAHATPLVRDLAPEARLVLNLADLHSLRMLRGAAASGDPDDHVAALLEQERETAAMRASDLVLSYSPEEAVAAFCLTAGRPHVGVFPFTTAVRPSSAPLSQRSECAFLGSLEHPPNLEALTWLARNALPVILEQRPDFQLSAYGSGLSLGQKSLGDAAIVWRGFAPDLDAMFDRCRIFLAPIVSGAGIKGKVLQALSRGVPCVLSPVAAEGLALRHGVECFIATEPHDWADAIGALMEDDALWERMSAAALAFTASNLSFDIGRRRLEAELRGVGLDPLPPPPPPPPAEPEPEPEPAPEPEPEPPPPPPPPPPPAPPTFSGWLRSVFGRT
jgi:hypothetical protein